MTLLLVGVLIVGVVVAVALAGLFAVRRSVALSLLQDHHDVAGFFIGVPNIKAQALMTAGLTTMIGLTLFLIFSINHPFRGDFSVDTTAFEEAIEVMTAA